MARPPIYGLLAEFSTPQALVDAAHKVHEAGFQKVDAFTPYPMEEVIEALHQHDSKVPWLVFLGGCAGAGRPGRLEPRHLSLHVRVRRARNPLLCSELTRSDPGRTIGPRTEGPATASWMSPATAAARPTSSKRR